ncbi:MAG TPA: phosphohistidine phosphatase SixA [Candidatus Polarisedimenticolia bacterium]|jgi:phosphohistidine phosphatase|nr:phosphohistidine phosphatase SixA [Candidatus Polarisedimenticolia bacterium]
MRIYLLRHAIAEPRNSRLYADDRERPVSPQGEERMRTGARGMSALGLTFDLVLTSPLLRARQTAKIVVRTLRPHPPLNVSPLLEPDASLPELLRHLASLPTGNSILLVGHEPDLSSFASLLLAGSGRKLPLEFKKGGFCRIDFPGGPRAGGGRLFFHLAPRILRRLGKTVAK